MKKLTLLFFVLAAWLVPAQATTVMVFDNPTYVDPTSATDLQAALTAMGYTVSTFTGIDPTSIGTAIGSANLILFPGLLNFGALAGNLSLASDAELAAYVSNGGGLIATGGNGDRVLNVVFYPTCNFTTVFCFASSGTSGPSFQDPAVTTGTPYASDPATLSDPPQADGAENPFAFTPPGGLNLYRDEVGGVFNGATVLTAPFGSGQYGLLTWDFAGSAPDGSLDGGWDSVLGTVVQNVEGVATPEPGSGVLISIALAGLAGWRRRRTLAW